MAERPIHLDIQTRSSLLTAGTPSQPGRQERQAPDADTLGRFARAMQADAQSSQINPSPTGESAPLPFSGPLGLFSQGASNSAHTPRVPPQMLEQLTQGVRQMLVGQEQRSMQLSLDETLMPGVKVKVFEDAGAWVAEFACTDTRSYERLAAASNPMASQLAQALAQDALWRVLLLGAQPEPLQTTEAFASAPGSH
jgi:hypothetical protein